HHVEHRLVDQLKDGRVDLAGHDARTGLHRGQADLVQAGCRPGGQQAQVVDDAYQVLRQRAERRAEVDEVLLRLHRLEQVVRPVQLKAGELLQLLNHSRGVLRMGVEARTYGSAADTQPAQPIRRIGDLIRITLDGTRIRAKLLAQPDRYGVLQMRAPRLHHVVEGPRTLVERVREIVQRFEQLIQPPQAA